MPDTPDPASAPAGPPEPTRQLSTPTDPDTTDPESPVRAPAPPGGRPVTIGKYVVVSALDAGGQAVVYRAVHPTLGREVAIKLARIPLKADRDAVSALQAEGRILAGLDHPNLARVYDLDVHEGRPYLVIEYVRGRNLEQWAREERPSPARAAELVAQAARAVAAANQQGIIHQDLKPQNILVDEAGRPRVIDFGMARLRHAWSDDAGGPSRGTPSYAAPEQARGQSERVGQRTDVFGLGGVLYFLLTGKAPFEGRNSTEALERARRCDWDQAALPAAGVPRQLQAVCRRALAEDPDGRYASADDLAADLERFARRSLHWAALAGAAALLLLAGLAVYASQRDSSTNRVPRNDLGGDASPALAVRVWRDDRPHDLGEVLPLETGDELQVRTEVPGGFHASLWLINGKGRPQFLMDEPPQGAAHEMVYPPGRSAPLEGPPGTECLVLILQRSGTVRHDEVERLCAMGGPWPVLPGDVMLRLDDNGVQRVQGERPRDLGPPGKQRPDPENDVRARLDELRQRLRDHFDDVAGVAFSHEDAGGR